MSPHLYEAEIEELQAVIREFFALLDTVEVSDSGREFHPVTIGCCRTTLIPKLEDVLKRMKEAAE